MSGPPPPLVPTGRRLEALILAANGCGNAVIARRMGISQPTVQRHLQDVYGLLGVRDRAHAVSVALVLGLIGPEEIRLPESAPVAPSRAHGDSVAAVEPLEARGERRTTTGRPGGHGGAPVERLVGPVRTGTDAGGTNGPQEAQNGPSRARRASGGPVPASRP